MAFAVLIVYCLSIVAFCLAFSRLRLVATARQVITIGLRAATIIRDPMLDDLAKEKQIQELSIEMLKSFFGITIRGILVAAAAALPALIAAGIGVIELTDLLAFSIRWDVILVTIAGLTGAALFARRLRAPGGR